MSALSLLVSPPRPPKIKHARRISNGHTEDVSWEPKKSADERKGEVIAYLEAYPRSKIYAITMAMGVKNVTRVGRLLRELVAEGRVDMVTAEKVETFYSVRAG